MKYLSLYFSRSPGYFFAAAFFGVFFGAGFLAAFGAFLAGDFLAAVVFFAAFLAGLCKFKIYIDK